MIRNRITAQTNAALRRQLKKGVREGIVANRTQAMVQAQRSATTSAAQTKQKVDPLNRMGGLPILTKSQSPNSNSVTSRVSGDAFQRSSSPQPEPQYVLADLSLANMATHNGKAPSPRKTYSTKSSIIHADSVNETDSFDSNNTLNSADRFMMKEHPSLRPSTFDTGSAESASIVQGDTVNSTDYSFNSSVSLNASDQYRLNHDPELKERNRVRTGSMVAGDSIASTDWKFNSAASTSSHKSESQVASPQPAKAKSQSSAIPATNNESSEISLDSTSFDSAKGTEKFDPSDIGEGFHPNSQQTSGTGRLKDLKKRTEEVTDYERAKEIALRKAELANDLAFTKINYPKTLAHYREKPNVSFEPGELIPAEAALKSTELTVRHLQSTPVDYAGLKQHGLAEDMEAYRRHVAESYKATFPTKIDRILGWAPRAIKLSPEQIAHSQRYTAQNSAIVP